MAASELAIYVANRAWKCAQLIRYPPAVECNPSYTLKHTRYGPYPDYAGAKAHLFRLHPPGCPLVPSSWTQR